MGVWQTGLMAQSSLLCFSFAVIAVERSISCISEDWKRSHCHFHLYYYVNFGLWIGIARTSGIGCVGVVAALAITRLCVGACASGCPMSSLAFVVVARSLPLLCSRKLMPSRGAFSEKSDVARNVRFLILILLRLKCIAMLGVIHRSALDSGPVVLRPPSDEDLSHIRRRDTSQRMPLSSENAVTSRAQLHTLAYSLRETC